MLNSAIRNTVVLIGIMIVMVVELRDYTTLMNSPSVTAGRDGASDLRTGKGAATGGEEWTRREQPRVSVRGNRLVVEARANGHYFVDATGNGRGVSLMVDTGASLVTLSRDDAARLCGLPTRLGGPGKGRQRHGPPRRRRPGRNRDRRHRRQERAGGGHRRASGRVAAGVELSFPARRIRSEGRLAHLEMVATPLAHPSPVHCTRRTLAWNSGLLSGDKARTNSASAVFCISDRSTAMRPKSTANAPAPIATTANMAL